MKPIAPIIVAVIKACHQMLMKCGTTAVSLVQT